MVLNLQLHALDFDVLKSRQRQTVIFPPYLYASLTLQNTQKFRYNRTSLMSANTLHDPIASTAFERPTFPSQKRDVETGSQLKFRPIRRLISSSEGFLSRLALSVVQNAFTIAQYSKIFYAMCMAAVRILIRYLLFVTSITSYRQP